MSAKHRRKPYMPDSDHGKVLWMERFLAVLERDPAYYGFDDARLFEYIQRTIRTFIDAAREVSNPGKRSRSLVSRKNEARAEAVALCRELAMRLKFDPQLSDDEKRALGLSVDSAPPEEATLPGGVIAGSLGHPTLAVQSSPNGGHVIRYSDAAKESKAKPKGVSHLLLFAAIGEKPRMRRTHARLLGAYTKRPFEIMWPMSCGIEGLYATYYGRWLTTRGEMSPWSPGVSQIIGGTQVSLRESPFSHLFEKEGFIDALPEGAAERRAQIEAVERPMLPAAASETEALFSALEAKADPRMLPWRAFALLESEM